MVSNNKKNGGVSRRVLQFVAILVIVSVIFPGAALAAPTVTPTLSIVPGILMQGIAPTAQLWNGAPNSLVYADQLSGPGGVKYMLGPFGTTNASGYFATSLNTYNMAPGSYTFRVYTVQAVGPRVRNSGYSNTKPLVITDGSPVGSLDSVNLGGNGRAIGWAVDPYPLLYQPSTVNISIDGWVGILCLDTGYTRSDINNYYSISGRHGFEFPVPSAFKDGQTHSLSAVGNNADMGAPAGGPATLWNSPKSFTINGSVPALPNTSNPNLKYFGYLLNGASESDKLYIDETYSFTNMGVIGGIAYNGNYSSYLNYMASHQMKAVLQVSDIFFVRDPSGKDGSVSARSCADYDLRSDYQSRWNTFVANNPNLASQALAFQLFDEPAWNGATSADLQSAAAAIKSTFSSIPIAVNESYAALDYFSVPTNVDWIGWQIYGIENPQSSNLFKKLYALMKTKRSSPSQKIFIIMDAWWGQTLHGAKGLTQAEMAQVATRYYDIARYDPDIVGIVAAKWKNGWPDYPDALGTRSLPAGVKTEHQRIGRLITGK